MLKLNGTSTCSLGESMDLKHAADLEAPPDVPVWDDLPHPPARPGVAPSTPVRPAGPCLSDSDLCTTDSCSSLGPEQPNQASCAACACRAHPAAPCTIPRTPTATRPSTLYENETYFQPSDNLCLPPSQIGQVYIAQPVPRNGQPLPPPICSDVPPSASPPPLPLQLLPSPPTSTPGLSQLPWARLLSLGLPQPPLVPSPPSPPQPQLPAPRLSPSPSSPPPRMPPAPSSPPWLPQSPPLQQLLPSPPSSARPPTEPLTWPVAPQLPPLPTSRSPVRVGVLGLDFARHGTTSTRVSGVASLASGGYCAPAVLYPSSTAHTEHATASANCLEADAAHGCAQLLGSSSRGCRYREHRGAACPTLPVDGHGGCNSRPCVCLWPSCSLEPIC